MVKNVLNKIEKHFQRLSLCEKIVFVTLNEEKNENAIIKIEKHFNIKLNDEIKIILKKYQGLSFRDNAGFNVSCKIPVLGNCDFLEFGGGLTLTDSPYSM